MRNLWIFFCVIPNVLLAQVAKEYALMLRAETLQNPARIVLKWPSSSASSYFVYKKSKSDASFPVTFELLNGSATSYTDTAITPGESYEYYVKKNGGSAPAYAYINAGLEVDAEMNGTGSKGKLILLIDSTHADTLNAEIDRLINDLEGEGWTVFSNIVSPNDKVADVKQVITDIYSNDPAHTKAVFLLGHIPVPYSGNIVPDGHSNHVGAWPADAFYGDMNGNWTDVSVNNTSGADTRTHNVPGDEKYDQSTIPSLLELQVGRVDLHDMPAFSKPESELLRDYLDKNHAFRRKEIELTNRALIDDNFGGFSGEAFAASAWKAFTTFFDEDSIYSNTINGSDYRTDLNARSYLWSYGCGGGTYTSAGGIGNTGQIASDSLQSVFTLLFGSYFGDWDKTNNFLRAPLAQGLTLTNAWSGRPHWYFHHMAIGENIGYSFLSTINNNNTYNQSFKKYVHIALMGDPTLRMFIVAPPSNLQLTENSNSVDLSWDASPENVLGYDVYRRDSIDDVYVKVNDVLVTGTSFTDTEFVRNGSFRYAVRAVTLEERRSGSYYNLSGGATGEIETNYTRIDQAEKKYSIRLFPNPSDGIFQIECRDLPSDQYQVVVYNVSGQIIKNIRLKLENKNYFSLDLSNEKEGAYIMLLQGREVHEQFKLILQK